MSNTDPFAARDAAQPAWDAFCCAVSFSDYDGWTDETGYYHATGSLVYLDDVVVGRVHLDDVDDLWVAVDREGAIVGAEIARVDAASHLATA